MKIKILVAFMATATIIFISCTWFGSKKKDSSNPLVGEWKLDSVTGKDSSAVSLFAMPALNDSNEVKISFTKDSVFTQTGNGIDVVGYSFDQEKNLLTFKDSTNQTLAFSKLSDSTISFTNANSSVVIMQKK